MALGKDIAVERVTLAALSPYLKRSTRLKVGKSDRLREIFRRGTRGGIVAF